MYGNKSDRQEELS